MCPEYTQLAGGPGFEPGHSDPESDVLPLDDPPTLDLILTGKFFSLFFAAESNFQIATFPTEKYVTFPSQPAQTH